MLFPYMVRNGDAKGIQRLRLSQYSSIIHVRHIFTSDAFALVA